MSITVINLSNPINELPKKIKNWHDIPEAVQNELLKGEYFSFRNWQSLLIYKDRQCIIDCMVSIDPEGNAVKLLNAYNREGRIF